MKYIHVVLWLLVVIIVPVSVEASLSISEIMYDVPGTDTGREWVEVYNGGDSAVTITSWKLFEQGVNHGINAYQGGEQLAGGQYAIIADNPEKFLADWPSFDGLLLDSAFSLNNTGEALSLRDGEGIDQFTVSYTATGAASGEGSTLHYDSGSWVVGNPSPGTGTFEVAPDENNENTGDVNNSGTQTDNNGSESEDETTTSVAATSATGAYPVYPHYTGNLEVPAAIVVDVPFMVELEVVRHNTGGSQQRKYGLFFYNFGDGTSFWRDQNEAIEYTYERAGTYTLYVSYASSSLDPEPDLVFQKTIKVTESPIIITTLSNDGTVVLENTAASRVDLSGWVLQQGEQRYIFPLHTYLSSKSTIGVTTEQTDFVAGGSYVNLLYPSGRVADYYNIAETIVPKVVGSAARNVSSYDALAVAPNTGIVANNLRMPAQVGATMPVPSTYAWQLGGGLLVLCSLMLIMRRRLENSAEPEGAVKKPAPSPEGASPEVVRVSYRDISDIL